MKNAAPSSANAIQGRGAGESKGGCMIAARCTALALTLLLAAASGCSASAPKEVTPELTAALKDDLTAYLHERKTAEHISAISLSISLADGETVDVAEGTVSYGGGPAVTPSNLFGIGSNTKAMTAVLVQKLAADRKLALDDTLGKWLPQYGAWKSATIRQMLDMTSGIESYDNTIAMQMALSTHPLEFFTPQRLVAFAYPKARTTGWHYSNTGYILTQMIVEKAAKGSYTDLLRARVLRASGVSDLYYYPGVYPKQLRQRMVQGYFNNNGPGNEGLIPFLGKSVRDDSASWMQAAGGVVATPHAMAQWARQLYQGPILTDAERAEVETLVSNTTGKPIAGTSAKDPKAFGLGVSHMFIPDLGQFWFYEGETLGYRMVHAYFPEKNLVIAVGLNSQPRGDQDAVGGLMQAVAKTLKARGLF